MNWKIISLRRIPITISEYHEEHWAVRVQEHENRVASMVTALFDPMEIARSVSETLSGSGPSPWNIKMGQ